MKSRISYGSVMMLCMVVSTLSLANPPSRTTCQYKEYKHYQKAFIEDGYVNRDYCIDNPIVGECNPDPVYEPDNFYECRTDYQVAGKRDFLRIEDCDQS